MNANHKHTSNITQSLLNEITERDKAAQEMLKIVESGVTLPKPAPSELDQDPGGGYNPNHTFPQE